MLVQQVLYGLSHLLLPLATTLPYVSMALPTKTFHVNRIIQYGFFHLAQLQT